MYLEILNRSKMLQKSINGTNFVFILFSLHVSLTDVLFSRVSVMFRGGWLVVFEYIWRCFH